MCCRFNIRFNNLINIKLNDLSFDKCGHLSNDDLP